LTAGFLQEDKVRIHAGEEFLNLIEPAAAGDIPTHDMNHIRPRRCDVPGRKGSGFDLFYHAARLTSSSGAWNPSWVSVRAGDRRCFMDDLNEEHKAIVQTRLEPIAATRKATFRTLRRAKARKA